MTRILFVDDEKNYGLILGRMLRREGFDVETAESWQAALDAAERVQNQRAARFLAKPFELVDLLRAVREVIEGSEAEPQQH